MASLPANANGYGFYAVAPGCPEASKMPVRNRLSELTRFAGYPRSSQPRDTDIPPSCRCAHLTECARHNPWVEGEDADPLLALLAMLLIGAIAAGIALLLIE
jgi:hypothetical protein